MNTALSLKPAAQLRQFPALVKITAGDYEKIVSMILDEADKSGYFEIAYPIDAYDLRLTGTVETSYKCSQGDGVNTPREWLYSKTIDIETIDCVDIDENSVQCDFDPAKL